MSRTVRDATLASRTARRELKPSGQPYYRALEPGLLHLGYRKPLTGAGKWLARRYIGDGRYCLHKIGVADDFSDADGTVILDFKQAQAAARKLMVAQAGGTGTVADAVANYIRSLETAGRPARAIKDAHYRAKAFILPALGPIRLVDLTADNLQRWRDELARKPARLRTRNGKPQRHRDHNGDPEVLRARRASVNRTRTTLMAALNLAFKRGHITSDAAWRRDEPFKGVDTARVRYLTVAEAKRLINAADPEFRPILQAALLTGARYGQLAQLVASDFNPDAGTLRLRTRKGDGSERVYYAHLTDEARAFFHAACAGRRSRDLIFTHDDGRPWGKSHQDLPIEAASIRAGISPIANFHVSRHTYASHSVMNGVPLLVVAQALGHTDTRMVEKHYGHLAPSFAAEAIRKGAPRYGIKSGTVRPLGR